jgi:GntR family transcriptional regulator
MSNILDYNVNPDTTIPVYVQIENLVQFSIISNKISSGDFLPSLRKLFNEFTINPNTVAKAYRDLELRGIVRVSRGLGVIAYR